MARVLLGVTGGIAAYKAAELVRLLQQAGHGVRVMQTEASKRFVGAATFAALTGEPVLMNETRSTAVDEQGGTFPHLDAGRNADVLVVAPATASSIARMAAGIADDVLCATYLGFDGPVVVAPAMNVRMLEHPATQRALAQLHADGVVIVEPEEGHLACGDVGGGRLADIATIASVVERALTPRDRLDGRTIVVTAGGTREPIDDVRCITNRSSGRMGIAIADAAAQRGANVRLIVTRSVEPTLYAHIAPAAVVERAAELRSATHTAVRGADALVMAAAVSDFTVATAPGKIARNSGFVLELEPVQDIVAEVCAGADRPSTVIAFAAESGSDGVERATDKMRRKGVDAIVYNDVSRAGLGFESHRNAITVLTASGSAASYGPAPKTDLAHDVVDALFRLLTHESSASVVQ